MIAFLLACVVSPIHARSPAAASGRFTLTVERVSYLIGEPIYLRIGASESLPPSLEEGHYLLGIKRDEDPERVYHPPFRLRGAPMASGSLGPRTRFARLIAQDGGLLFGKPGRYRLRLLGLPAAGSPDTVGPSVTVLSDTLVCVFSHPTAPADVKGYALIERNPGEYALAVYLEGGDQLKEGMSILQELAASRSSYSRMASFILSSDWAQDFIDYHGGASRPLDLQKALAWAQWDKAPDIYIPLRNAFRLEQATGIQDARDPNAPGLATVKSRVGSFLASLTPQEMAWYRAFSPLSASGSSPVGAAPGR